jgi:hypothetical protein
LCTLRVEVIGTNPNSAEPHYSWGLDCVVLKPAKKFEFRDAWTDRDGFAVFADCFNLGRPDADPYHEGPGTLGCPAGAASANAFDHRRELA